MTRAEKIRKLGNAVREYRGLCRTVPVPGQKTDWVRPPNPSALPRVELWLERLNLPVMESVHQIRSMKSWQEFNDWIRNL